MINQIELSQQFDKIFTDEEVVDFFNEWWEEKNKKPEPKASWIRNLLLYLLIAGIILIPFFLIVPIYYGTVEQEVYTSKATGNVYYYTWVWKDGEIVQAWRTPIDNITDSIKTAQYKAGEALLKVLK